MRKRDQESIASEVWPQGEGPLGDLHRLLRFCGFCPARGLGLAGDLAGLGGCGMTKASGWRWIFANVAWQVYTFVVRVLTREMGVVGKLVRSLACNVPCGSKAGGDTQWLWSVSSEEAMLGREVGTVAKDYRKRRRSSRVVA